MTIGIIGLGIIGGSFARAIKAYTPHTVLAFNRSRSTLEAAISCGAADGELTAENIKACDLIIVCLPPEALIAWVRDWAPLIDTHTVVVDACGVKRPVVAALSPVAREHGFTFVGGHPMAGREVSGFVSSDERLWQGASMILTPEESLPDDTLDRLKKLFLSIGFGTVTVTTAEYHDRTIAYTSQLAHVASSAYIKSPTAQDHAGFSAGSFRDLTRVARLDPNLWTELFRDNSDYLLKELDELIFHLTEYREAIAAEDWNSVHALLKEGRELKLASMRE